jgi:starch phosphorylase
VNGVAKLHSELVKTRLVPDFYQLWPEKFNNKTNGVTQRRWLLKANPKLAQLINRTAGDEWITDLNHLRDLEPWADDAGFQEEFRRIKRANKERLARVIRDATEIEVDPDSLFDVQVKRIHEYKRQLLNVLHIIHDYVTAIDDGKLPLVPRTYVFAGKAAPGYWAAKQIIKLINNVGQVINKDVRVNEMMKVVFIPDYKVSLAERIIPAADLSEQISTAGKEASGTGNMKFAMNGALTIGTLDGANVEIREEVGGDNIYIFGLTAEEIEVMREMRTYNPREYYERNPALRRVLDALQSNLFCPEATNTFISPICRPTSTRRNWYRAPFCNRRCGRAKPSSTSRASASSPATGRFSNTRRTSGRLRAYKRDAATRRRGERETRRVGDAATRR